MRLQRPVSTPPFSPPLSVTSADKVNKLPASLQVHKERVLPVPQQLEDYPPLTSESVQQDGVHSVWHSMAVTVPPRSSTWQNNEIALSSIPTH